MKLLELLVPLIILGTISLSDCSVGANTHPADPGSPAAARHPLLSSRRESQTFAGQQRLRPPTLRFSDVRLKTGVRLRYATQGKPSGQPIILLHGYPDSSFSYSRVLPLLGSNFRIYVPDQRGHGESERPAGGYEIPSLAADVLAFMDAKGIKQAVIVGHSMGSFVAQHVAVKAPERVTRLVLVGSATTLRNDVTIELHKEIRAVRDPVPEKFIREFQESTVFQSVPKEFMDQIIKESLKLPARVLQAVINGFLEPEAKAELNKIRSPTLIIWGDKDSIFPRSEQDALIAAIPNATLKVYVETGHCPNWERPEQIVKDIEEFMMQGGRR